MTEDPTPAEDPDAAPDNDRGISVGRDASGNAVMIRTLRLVAARQTIDIS